MGGTVRHGIAQIISSFLYRESAVTIGLTELRAALNFVPLPPWKHFNYTEPSEDEFSSAPTIEAYYDMKEPVSSMRSLDSDYLLESNLSSAVAYLDKRFPSIRTIFRRKFEEIRKSHPGVLDRKIVDRMIDEIEAISDIIVRATSKINGSRECREERRKERPFW